MRSTVFVIALILLDPGSAVASCGELSYERNLIFKRAGYCFRTAAQISRFGNAGCQYDNQADVPLSARDRAAIAEILHGERVQGCR